MRHAPLMFMLHHLYSEYIGSRRPERVGQHRLLRHASRARRDAEAITEEGLLYLGVELRRLALLVSDILEHAYFRESSHGLLLQDVLEALSLCRKAQALLLEAMEREALCPAHFLELNADWARLSHHLEKMSGGQA